MGITGHAHGDAVGHGVLFHGFQGSAAGVGGVDGAAAPGLHGDEAGQFADEAHLVQVEEALPQAGDGAAVPHGHGHEIRHLPTQLFRDLEGHGLFALQQVGVDGGVAVVPAELFDGPGGETEGGAVVAFDAEHVGAEDEQLGDLALGRPLRHEDVGLEPGPGGVAR